MHFVQGLLKARRNSNYRPFQNTEAGASFQERYIKAFDPAVLAAMKRMETTLDAMKLCAPTVHQIN